MCESLILRNCLDRLKRFRLKAEGPNKSVFDSLGTPSPSSAFCGLPDAVPATPVAVLARFFTGGQDGREMPSWGSAFPGKGNRMSIWAVTIHHSFWLCRGGTLPPGFPSHSKGFSFSGMVSIFTPVFSGGNDKDILHDL